MDLDGETIAKLCAMTVSAVTASFFFHKAVMGPHIVCNGLFTGAFAVVAMMIWFSLGK